MRRRAALASELGVWPGFASPTDAACGAPARPRCHVSRNVVCFRWPARSWADAAERQRAAPSRGRWRWLVCSSERRACPDGCVRSPRARTRRRRCSRSCLASGLFALSRSSSFLACRAPWCWFRMGSRTLLAPRGPRRLPGMTPAAGLSGCRDRSSRRVSASARGSVTRCSRGISAHCDTLPLRWICR